MISPTLFSGPCLVFLSKTLAGGLGDTDGSPIRFADYPKQAHTHTLNYKIWFQKDPDSTEW